MLAGAEKIEFAAGLVIKTPLGGLFDPSTVRRKLVVPDKIPSLTVRTIVAVPSWLDRATRVSKRSAPVPLRVRFDGGTRLGFDDTAARVRSWTGFSASPIVNDSVTEPFFIIVWSWMAEIAGGVLVVMTTRRGEYNPGCSLDA